MVPKLHKNASAYLGSDNAWSPVCSWKQYGGSVLGALYIAIHFQMSSVQSYIALPYMLLWNVLSSKLKSDNAASFILYYLSAWRKHLHTCTLTHHWSHILPMCTPSWPVHHSIIQTVCPPCLYTIWVSICLSCSLPQRLSWSGLTYMCRCCKTTTLVASDQVLIHTSWEGLGCSGLRYRFSWTLLDCPGPSWVHSKTGLAGLSGEVTENPRSGHWKAWPLLWGCGKPSYFWNVATFCDLISGFHIRISPESNALLMVVCVMNIHCNYREPILGELWLWVTALLNTVWESWSPFGCSHCSWRLPLASQAHSFLPFWEMLLILDEQTILGGSRDFPTFPLWLQLGAACLLLPPGTTGPP
jgi:hypothetical protein